MDVQRRGPAPALGLLASCLAGRPVEVAYEHTVGWTDGETVHADSRLSAARLREQVIVQSLLIGAASIPGQRLRSRWRQDSTARRYMLLEVARILQDEPWLRRHVDLPRGVAVPADRTDSLRIARTRATLPPTPAFWGMLGAQKAMTAPASSSTTPWPELPAPDQHVEVVAEPGNVTTVERDDRDPPLSTTNRRRRRGKRVSPAARRGSPRTGAGALIQVETPLFRSNRPMHRGSSLISRAADGTAAGLTRTRTQLYPEWDFARRNYRERWCTVHEIPRSAEVPGAEIPPLRAWLRRDLAPIALGLGRCRHQTSGDSLDLDAVVAARIDARHGLSTEDVYVATRRVRRDLSVFVLLDASGSVSERGHDGSTSIHALQLELCDVLVGTLAGLGDRVCCSAFRSFGRADVRFHSIKSFDEAWLSARRRHLYAVRPAGFTRLGAAIRHGTDVLSQHGGTDRRLLLLVSDAFPYDDGYSGEYAKADTVRSVAEARSTGVATGCVILGSQEDAREVERTLAGCAAASMTSPSELGPLIAPLLTRAFANLQAGA